MTDDLDAFANGLQSAIDMETRKEWGEEAFNRWVSPPNAGIMVDADARASLRGSCGDQISIYLKLRDQRVTNATFWTDGCGPSIVCASIAAEKAEGRTIEELIDLRGDDILSNAGGIPEDHHHCAFLAASVLREAVNGFMIKNVKNL